jgi:DNA transformation protein
VAAASNNRSTRKRRRATRRVTSSSQAGTEKLYGLGPYSQRLLAGAGIHNRADLERLGPVGAYVAVIKSGGKLSLNLLWAIAGALSGIHWTKLEPEYRSSLLREYDAWCDQRAP